MSSNVLCSPFLHCSHSNQSTFMWDANKARAHKYSAFPTKWKNVWTFSVHISKMVNKIQQGRPDQKNIACTSIKISRRAMALAMKSVHTMESVKKKKPILFPKWQNIKTGLNVGGASSLRWRCPIVTYSILFLIREHYACPLPHVVVLGKHHIIVFEVHWRGHSGLDLYVPCSTWSHCV